MATRAEAVTPRLWQRRSVRTGVRLAAVYTVLTLGAIIILIPVAWMLSTAFKANGDVMLFPPKWIPKPFVVRPFGEAFQTMHYFRALRNTLIIASGQIAGSLLTASMAAYGFSRLRFPGRDVIFFVLLSTIMLPGTVTIIPLYILFRHLHWLNTFLPLIVPSWFGGGVFNIFLLRQFFMTISEEICNAARIDGCGHIAIYWRIIIPLGLPGMITVFIFLFMGSWNDFFAPLIYLNSTRLYPLTLTLEWFVGKYVVLWNQLMAGTLMVAVPPIILFFFTQRYFIRGVVFTGVKA
ncbi:MAG: carbohydrate ABC transporter permease, partial [Chloroflexi bacterium]|nr:carbohydrate ABC transporter permease [Chloroflexota bacterium]